jgi:hypothetical protein
MKHKHHIIPKHAGGTDDPSNLIELTVEEHAEAHRLLYEQHGRWEDYYAWQGLSGRIGKEELIRQIQSVANSKPKSEETKKKMSAWQIGRKLSEEHKQKCSIKQKERWKQGKYDPEKLRLSRIGFKQPESQKKAVAKALSKEYLITNPQGNQFKIKNLNQFCRDNKLDQGNMSRNRVKGWTCVKLET